MDIKDIIGMIPALLLFIGVPVFMVIRRRRLARMSELERRSAKLEYDRWYDEMMDPANGSGWTNPSSPVYTGIRHDDD